MRYYTRNNDGTLNLHNVNYIDPLLWEWTINAIQPDTDEKSKPVHTKLLGWPDKRVVECNNGRVLFPVRAARKLGII